MIEKFAASGIKIEHLNAGYPGEVILHDISLDFKPGKVTVIIGPNGCGKSTLLKTMIRLIQPISGAVFVDGKPAETMSAAQIARAVAYIPQSRKVPDISVERMVLHGRFPYLKYPRRYRKEDYDAARNAMKWIGIEDLAEKNVSELSGGTQQKVYIAMAFAQDTPTILMDEPTVYLDISHQMKMMNIAKKLAEQGKAVVMIMHDLPQSFETADEIILMSEGKIVITGTPEEVFQSGMADKIFDIKFERINYEGYWKYFINN